MQHKKVDEAVLNQFLHDKFNCETEMFHILTHEIIFWLFNSS